MKISRRHLCIMATLGLTLAVGGNVKAQLPISQTEGILAVPLPPNAVTQLGLPFTRTPVARAEIVSVAGSVITVSGTPFVAGDYALSPHSLVILGGINDGRSLPIVSNLASAVTVSGAVPAGNAPGSTSVMILPDWTLNTLFGSTPVQVGGLLNIAATPATADKVSIEENGVVTDYYFSSTTIGWRRADGTNPTVDQGNVRIANQKGVIVTRIAGGPNADIVLTGKVRSGTQRILTRPGAVTIASLPFSSTTTLNSSGLSSGVAPSSNPAAADKVSVDNGTSIVQYFFNASNGGQWLRVDGTAGNFGTLTLPPGRSLRIERAGGAPTYPTGWRPGRPRRFFIPVVAQPPLVWRALQPFAS
jgi:hypothetical protein